jgi:sortase A
MVTYHRIQPSTTNSDALELLQTLLATPLAPSTERRHRLTAEDSLTLLQTLLTTPFQTLGYPRKAPCWSQNLQHSVVQPRSLRAISLDRALQGIQWMSIAAALVAFGYWTAQVPVRNWLYQKQAPLVATASVAEPLSTSRVLFDHESAGLSAVSTRLRKDDTLSAPTMHALAPQLPEEDYLVPRQMRPEQIVADLPQQPTHLLIPSINLDTPVVETFVNDDWRWETAKYAAGYLHGTGLPGDPTNMVMAGHAGFFGGVFANLYVLAPGDDIFVDAAGWRYRYRMREQQIVWPTEIQVTDPTPTAVLTLITCTNWDLQRLVVIADLVDSKPL